MKILSVILTFSFLLVDSQDECGFENDKGICVKSRKCLEGGVVNLTYVPSGSVNAYKVPLRCTGLTDICCQPTFVKQSSKSSSTSQLSPTTPVPHVTQISNFQTSDPECKNDREYGFCTNECIQENRIYEYFGAPASERSVQGILCKSEKFCCAFAEKNSCSGKCLRTCPPDWIILEPTITTTDTPIMTTPNFGMFVIEEKYGSGRHSGTACNVMEFKCCIPPNSSKNEEVMPKNDLCGRYNPITLGDRVSMGETADFAEFPWLVIIANKFLWNDTAYATVYKASGSLISPTVVLTTAHSIDEITDLEGLIIRAGDYDVSAPIERLPHQEILVKKIIKHENFHRPTHINNVALLILEKPVALTPNIGVVCLPPPSHELDVGSKCMIAGWGKDHYEEHLGLYQTVLKKAAVDLVDHDRCQTRMRFTKLGNDFVLHDTFTCAIGENGEDTCKGDGGTPLVCPLKTDSSRFFLKGLTSWGIGCGTKELPGIYVDVSKFRKWIYKKINEEGEFLKEK